ncbi:MAG: CPBP family intramembrane metalloprotease [Flavobacteriaceae bacterium]|nr:CPBP family intramembrane metalloprotease [Flavobacteriaceae bacterium]
MKKLSTLNQIVFFTGFIVFILLLNNSIKEALLSNGIDSYNFHLGVKAFSNCILGIVSFFIARKLNLIKLGGLSKTKPKKLWLLIFPLLFLVSLNGLFLDTIPNYNALNLIILSIYCLSIGISEELSIRSVLLPLLIRFFGKGKKATIKAILISSLIFGLLHLIKFDKGIYGEISQVFFATFIGISFGAILVVIKRIYPLIIAHAVIDFVAKLDSINTPIKEVVAQPMNIENSLITVLLTIPCLLYGVYVIKKQISLN